MQLFFYERMIIGLSGKKYITTLDKCPATCFYNYEGGFLNKLRPLITSEYHS